MGKPRNTQKYPTYPEIPEIPGNTRKKKRYPEIPDRIFQHSYPTRTRPATRYFVQYPTRPDPILKNPTRWALFVRSSKLTALNFPGYSCFRFYQPVPCGHIDQISYSETLCEWFQKFMKKIWTRKHQAS